MRLCVRLPFSFFTSVLHNAGADTLLSSVAGFSLLIKEAISKQRVERALSAIGHRIAYKMGHGGNFPGDPLPTRDGKCDCSGFIAWVLGLSRKPKAGRQWWIETTAIWNDARGEEKVFERLIKPEPGCIVVYPDSDGHQGHVACVTAVRPNGQYDVADCSLGHRGITQHVGTAFMSRSDSVFCMLKQDAA